MKTFSLGRFQRNVLLLGLGVAVFTPASWAQAVLPLIDAHAHLNFVTTGKKSASMDFPASVAGAIGRMDQNGFSRTILMPQPSPPESNNKWEADKLDFAITTYPDRISRGGGGGTLNPMIQAIAPEAVDDAVRAKFRAAALAVLASKPVVLGEVTAHHLSMKAMGPQHGYESVPADHPLILMLADIAAEHGIPVDLHFDVVPEDMTRPDLPIFNDKNPLQLKSNLAAFERLLAHNRNAIIIWAHAGSDPLRVRTIEVQRELLRKHPNLVMSLKLGQLGGGSPVVALGPQGGMKPVWLQFLTEFSDRFVLGSDFFHGPADASTRGPEEASLGKYTAALSKLPKDLAEALAFRNAVRIFKLPVPLQSPSPLAKDRPSAGSQSASSGTQ